MPEHLYRYEPTEGKKINNYFKLRLIEVIKLALSDVQHGKLAKSQLRQIMLMWFHIFPVMFVYQLLSRNGYFYQKTIGMYTFIIYPNILFYVIVIVYYICSSLFITLIVFLFIILIFSFPTSLPLHFFCLYWL